MRSFGAAFGLTFVAELGDKTQIAILTLSARYGFAPVFLGAAAAFVVLNALAVTAGELLARYVPADVIRYVAAAVFVVFGLLSFRPESERAGQEEAGQKAGVSRRGPFITSLLYVGLLELGDKTQLSLIALTSKYEQPVRIFLGGTLALLLTSFIAAIAGKALAKVVPMKYIRWGSGVVFIVFGILIAVGVI